MIPFYGVYLLFTTFSVQNQSKITKPYNEHSFKKEMKKKNQKSLLSPSHSPSTIKALKWKGNIKHAKHATAQTKE